jgi:hypothetical protein
MLILAMTINLYIDGIDRSYHSKEFLLPEPFTRNPMEPVPLCRCFKHITRTVPTVSVGPMTIDH